MMIKRQIGPITLLQLMRNLMMTMRQKRLFKEGINLTKTFNAVPVGKMGMKS